MKWTILKKFLAALVPVILIAVFMMSYFAYSGSAEHLLKLEEERTLLLIDKTVEDINNWLDERMAQVKLFSQTELFVLASQDQEVDSARKLLERYHKTYPYYENIFVASPSGVILVDSIQGKSVGIDISKMPNYTINVQKAASGTAWQGEVFKSPATGRPVALLTAPIMSNGKLIGILGTPLEIQLLSKQLVSNIKIGKTGYIYITDANGTFLAHPVEKNILNTSLQKLEFGPRMMAQKEGTLAYVFQGSNRVAHFRTNPKNGWIVATSISEEELLQPINNVTLTLTIVGILAIAFLIITITLISRRLISNPIQGMVQTLSDVANGNLSTSIEIKGNDEISELGAAMERMVEAEKELARAATVISQGDLSVTITPRSEHDTLSQSLLGVVTSLKALQDDIGSMIAAQKTGDIEAHCNADKFSGAYAELSKGINEALDVISAPVVEAIGIMNEYANGEFKRAMRDLPGKQIILTKGMNGIRSNLLSLIDEIQMLIDAAIKGDLHVRGKYQQFNASYSEVIQGINDILNAVITPINEASDVLQQLSDRNLTARMNGNYRGDYDKIKSYMNQTADVLENAIAQTARASEQVASASNEIASSSQQVAEGASEQASSLEETSSSLEEMSGMTKQNAENATQAKAMTETVNNLAMDAGSYMKEMVDAMGNISEASKGTSAIIKDINEIAFQTNLLALNAAVEAARAGEAGRGFAVVAEEVRNLALRSKEAALKTEELIRESVSLSENGQTISSQVAGKLDDIVKSIDKTTAIVAEIASASDEQARGIDQVNRAVAQMDKVTQQNAANSEESASSAEELASQSQELTALVRQFQISETLLGQKKSNFSPSDKRALTTDTSPKQSNKPKRQDKQELTRNSGNSGIHVSPEELIPLDDDPDYADF